jgi:S1-C subfamily serine protease/DNA-binding NarL/FixJ family response regulator
VPAFGKEA